MTSVETAYTRLTWPVGDSWSSAGEWAVIVDGQPIDLHSGGWSALAQVRDRRTDEVCATWSTSPGPGVGDIVIGSATITVDDIGTEVTASTVRLRHSAATSRAWGPFRGDLDLQITRTVAGEVVANHTILRATVRAEQDVTR